MVQLGVQKQIAVTCDHRIKLQLNEAECAAEEIRPEGCLAYSLCTTIHPVLSDLKHILDKTTASLDERCQINEWDEAVRLERNAKPGLEKRGREEHWQDDEKGYLSRSQAPMAWID